MGEASDGAGNKPASPLALILGFAVLYVVWGSTYLAIKIAVETLPPFLMAGIRFLTAGTILLVYCKLRGEPWPRPRQWRNAVITGTLLLMCGNGGVVWAEKELVPSGLTAMLVTTSPLFLALFDWLRPGGTRPPGSTWLGLFVGFGGMILLASTGKSTGDQALPVWGIAALFISSIAWALGSLIAKHADKPASAVMSTAIQMLCGGAMLFGLSPTSGELATFQPEAVTLKSILAVGYLLVMGSLLTMTVFNWLLHVVEPTLVSTNAFVNPVIAVLLGWLLADEALSGITLVSGGIIIASVAWIIIMQWRRKRLSQVGEIAPEIADDK